MESTICSRAIDGFLSGFKDQLTNTVSTLINIENSYFSIVGVPVQLTSMLPFIDMSQDILK